jgi:sugar phosphate permease
MQKIFWILTILGSALGALTALVGVMTAKGAPQEAAAAAVGLAFAVIPYCLARAVGELSAIKPKDDELQS